MNTPIESSGADLHDASGRAVSYDAGLRRYMLGIYRTMALGLVLTGLVAFLVASTPALYQPIFNTPLKWVVILAPLAFVLFFSFRVEQMSANTARIAFYSFAAIMGLSLASVFLVFTGTSIALAFFSAAALFATMCLWGYTTNVDLRAGRPSSWSGFLGRHRESYQPVPCLRQTAVRRLDHRRAGLHRPYRLG
jgi:FtsH-binding integral membrane protein